MAATFVFPCKIDCLLRVVFGRLIQDTLCQNSGCDKESCVKILVVIKSWKKN